MRNIGALNLSLAELALNMLAVTMLLLIIAHSRIRAMVPALELEQAGDLLHRQQRELDLTNSLLSNLVVERAEQESRAEKLQLQLDEAQKNVSKITPTCAGGPAFSARVEGSARYRIGGEVLDLAGVLARFADYTAPRTRVGRGCISQVNVQANRALDSAVAFTAIRQLAPYFRVVCLEDKDE